MGIHCIKSKEIPLYTRMNEIRMNQEIQNEMVKENFFRRLKYYHVIGIST
jgi:hypothetical protein